MRHSIFAAWLPAATVSAALVLPAPALATAPAEEPVRVSLEVDASELGSRGVGMDGLVERELGPAFARAGVELVKGDGEAIRVRVRVTVLKAEEFDYGIHIEFVEGDAESAEGERAKPAMEWIACMVCADVKLAEVLEEKGDAIATAVVKHAEREAEGAVEASEPTGDGDVTDPVEGPEPVKAMGAMGGVGIGVLALGVGSTIAGAVLLSRGKVFDPLSDRRRTFVDNRPPGIALLSVGVAAVVTGGALLTADLVVRNKKRRKQRSTNQAFYPVVGVEMLGIGYATRF